MLKQDGMPKNCAHLFSNEFYKFLKNFCWRVRVWLAERVESGSPNLPTEWRREKTKSISLTLFVPRVLFHLNFNYFIDLAYYILIYLEMQGKYRQ